MKNCMGIGTLLILVLASGNVGANPRPDAAIVIRDAVALRAAPRDSAQSQTQLWQGELVEVRGERMDYVQVYDYRRERGGYVRADQLRRVRLTAEAAPELLAVIHFMHDTPGAEPLLIGISAAYIQAASGETMRSEAGIEVLDSMAAAAERLARRASSGATPSRAAETALSAHLDVAARYGVNFVSYERDGRIQYCYDGAAFRAVLALNSSADHRARAVLALTRPECQPRDTSAMERAQAEQQRLALLDQVDVSALPDYLRNRVHMRRAALWSAAAYQNVRRGDSGVAAATKAIAEFAGVRQTELTDHDKAIYAETAMRVNATRWAAVAPNVAPAPATGLTMAAVSRQPGETCVSLIDIKRGADHPLATRCTYGVVWTNSITRNKEGNALAVAVQTMESWRELWVFRRDADGWSVNVLPPAATSPEIGYAEFAGWAPGGRQMLVAREARGEGRYRRAFELVRLDTLTTERQAEDPSILGAFQRWQDAGWKRNSLSMR